MAPPGKPTRLAPRPKPAPWRAVKPTEGASRSRIANTTAATTDTLTISSRLGTRRGIITMATATARPSNKYLTTRVTSSVTDRSICFLYKEEDFLQIRKGFKLYKYINIIMAEEREEYLESDKEIPGQRYVALSFISPENVLANKDIHMFQAFLNDYEIQYKIKATEDFLMKQMRLVTDALSKAEDTIQEVVNKINNSTIAISDVDNTNEVFRKTRASLARDVAISLENHVKENMKDFKLTTIQEAYDSFMFKNRKKLEDEFFAKNNFRTTVRGLKVRGSFDTYEEAAHRAKTLQKLDPSFNVYVAQVGFWLPWDPSTNEIQNQEFAEDQLNTLMKNYKDNEIKKDEFFESQKREKLAGARIRAGNPVVGTPDAPVEIETPKNMFDEPDLAIARKKTLSSS